MAFQPLGYKFEVFSPEEPERVKSKIVQKKEPWLYPGVAPRGWVLGPFLCLWLKLTTNGNGPMILATIRSHQSGTRIVGRAGWDLNGVILLLLLLPLVVFGVARQLLVTNDASDEPVLYVLVLAISGRAAR